MLPKALVTVTVTRIAELDPAVFAGAKSAYALARIGGLLFGRSRAMPLSGGDFDLTREPMPWTNRLEADGSDIPVSVEIWDDRGDDAPVLLTSTSSVVPAPYFSIDMTVGGKPGIGLKVASDLVPTLVAMAPIPRVPPALSTRATLRPVNSLVVQLTDIIGLYAPVAPGVAGMQRSERRAGYSSADHQGRAFLNHDLAKTWKSGTQQIELEARVTATRGAIPADAQVHWHVLDVDDVSNDSPNVHQQWGSYLDKHDYDAAGKQTGAAGKDNEGKPEHDPPWLESAGFALSSKAKNEATTAVVGGTSKVVFHCPSTAGDNFVIAAEIQSKSRVESFGTRTGVITMWHHLQLQYVRMNGGFVLPVADVPVPFEKAFVEMEPAPEVVVADRPFMAAKEDDLDAESASYVDTVFTHKPDSGWFCIIAAMEPHPLPTLKGKKAFSGKVQLQAGGSGVRHYEYFEIGGAHPDVDFAELKFGTETVGFNLFSIQIETSAAKGTITRCWIGEHDAQPDFTAGDGSIKHAYATSYNYSPRFSKKGGAVKAGGYGMPPEVTTDVFEPGAFYTSGISPTVVKSKVEYFAGRTIIFTHHGAYRDSKTGLPRSRFHDEILQVMVHELVHAFGMPHKCGYFDFRTPRQKTCCMNYSPNWMVDDRRDLIPGSSDRVGMDMCGRHLKEVRRVRLQDNKGLAWK